MPLIQFTDNGLYCQAADVFIDPWRPVRRALITHAHSDHARWGSQHYLAHHQSRGMLYQRLGNISLQTVEYNKPLLLNGVRISFHPAGHIIGSSMIRLEHGAETWLITGDYKLENDGLSQPWEPVECTHMVTECTFGLPIYRWQPQEQIYRGMQQWVMANHGQQTTSVFYAYSLGKAQRIMQALAPLDIPMYAHGAVFQANDALKQDGVALPEVQLIEPGTTREALAGAIVIAPPSAAGSTWLRRMPNRQEANCSGWMQVRGNQRRNQADMGFVLSDHADWPSLLLAVQQCGAQQVYSTHGFTHSFSRYLRENMGIWSEAVTTQYGTEEEDKLPASPPTEEDKP